MSAIWSAIFGMAIAQGLPPRAIKIELDKPLKIDLESEAVEYHGNKLRIFAAGECSFKLELTRLGSPTFLIKPGSVPPGLYGVRWGHLPYAGDLEQRFILNPLEGPYLKATLKAAVVQYNDVEYRISCAVFDSKWRLLGTASAIEKVQYIRLGQLLTLFRDIELDFGRSKDYKDAAYAVFSVSNPKVPSPPRWLSVRD